MARGLVDTQRTSQLRPWIAAGVVIAAVSLAARPATGSGAPGAESSAHRPRTRRGPRTLVAALSTLAPQPEPGQPAASRRRDHYMEPPPLVVNPYKAFENVVYMPHEGRTTRGTVTMRPLKDT